jgi:hypothetical protein
MSNLSVAMSTNTIISIVPRLPANIAVLIKGGTGIGKSHITRGISNTLGMPVVDVRGSTMDEAGVTGIPDFEGSKEAQVSYFLTTSWFKRACDEPVVLFLDEMNRSLPQVLQSFFQIVLDRELGNDKNGMPRRLHPETRVIAAVNAGQAYDVNEIDPALLRRFWVCELSVDTDAWLNWGTEEGLSRSMLDFIRINPSELWVDPATVETGKVIPTPASWHRLDESLRFMNMGPDSFIGKGAPEGFYHVCAGFVGTEAAAKFIDHVKSMTADVSAADVLRDWSAVESRVSRTDASQMNKIVDRLVAHIKENGLTDEEGVQLAAFAAFAGGEVTIRLWTTASAGADAARVINPLHCAIGALVVEAAKAVTISKK